MKQVTITIPTPLRSYTDNQKKIEIKDVSIIEEALEKLILQYPKLEQHLYDNGEIRSFVNIYLNDEDIRYLDNLSKTKLTDGDSLTIIPAYAGGSRLED